MSLSNSKTALLNSDSNKVMSRIKQITLCGPISYGVVLLMAGVLYIGTCAPGALWQDSSMFHYRIWHNDIRGGLGLALAHPLYHMIGICVKYLPFGEYGYRINLISAIAGAFTVANVFLLVRLWLGKILPAVIGALTLALSWTFWQHCCIAEVYTLYTALFTAELIFLLQYIKTGRTGHLYLLGFFNGLSIANHMWGVMPLACYAVFLITLLIRKKLNVKRTSAIIIFWVVGAWPYGYLIVDTMIKTGAFSPTLSSAIFGGYTGAVLNTSLSLRMVLENILFIGLSFPTPNILLFLTGMFGLYKVSSDKGFVHIILTLLILFLVFAFRYSVPDRYAFFIPFYCLASIVTGAGSYLFFRKYPQKILPTAIIVLAFLPVLIYSLVPIISESFEIDLGTNRSIPYRNEYEYFLRPWQLGNNGPERFATEALGSVEDDAAIIADGTTVYVLRYIQEVKGKYSQAKVISKTIGYKNPIPFPAKDTIGKLMAERAVYVVSPTKGYCPQFLLERYDFIRAGVLYRVVERNFKTNEADL